jgi:tRNA (adenine22-N1)-methyltransferase
MVKNGSRVADVGCDHGFVPIYLVENGICSHVLAMDVRSGPLAGAQEHIREHGLEDYIETRLSDGLKMYRKGEADTMICAGMGGRLMLKILSDAGDKIKDFHEMILQPQSELYEFRMSIRRMGLRIKDENMVYEGGKYYFLMKVVHKNDFDGTEISENNRVGYPDENDISGENVFGKTDENRTDIYENITVSEVYDRYGEWLIKKNSPILRQFLEKSMDTLKEIEQNLKNSDGEKTRTRLMELQHEAACIRAAMNLLVQ